jgi:CheY-like chemotaxis protein
VACFDVLQDGLEALNQAHRVDYDVIFLSSSITGLETYEAAAALHVRP